MELRNASSGVSDDELIEKVRAGDTRAFGVLWQRHAGPALSVARTFPGLDAEDLVAEAFERLFDALRTGKGPREGFRPYLITTVRNVGRRQYNRAVPRADAEFDLMVDGRAHDGEHTAISDLDGRAAGEAFRSLPPRWQEALWYAEVDGMKPREMSGMLGIPANAVSALVLRAKRAFRDAWIGAQLAKTDAPECRDTIAQLGAFTRDGLSARARAKVVAHLATCHECTAALREAQTIAQTLSLAILPAVAGTAGAAGYLSTLRPPAIPEMQLPVATSAMSADGAIEQEPADADSTSRRGVLALLIVLVVLLGGGAAAIVPLLLVPRDGRVAEGPEDGSADGVEGGSGATVTPTPSATPFASPSPSASPENDNDGVADPGNGGRGEPDGSGTPPVSGGDEGAGPSNPGGAPNPSEPAAPGAPAARVVQPDERLYPRLTGDSAVPGAHIEVLDPSGAVVAKTTARTDGAWSARITKGQPGDYTVRVRQTVNGLSSATGPKLTYTVDAPPTPTTPAAGATVSASRFNFRMTTEPGTLLQRQLDAAQVQTLQPPSSGAWNEYLRVAPGEHTMKLRFADPVTGDYGPWSKTTFTAE